MDIDLILREEQSAPLTVESTLDVKRDFERWNRSNRISLMIMKHNISEAFRGIESEEITQPMYKGQGNVREYIMEMFHVTSRLKALKIELSKELLVLMVLVSLPTQFNQFKISYKCQKEKWTLNELISHCVHEEEKLKRISLKVLIWPIPLKTRARKENIIMKLLRVQLKRNNNKLQMSSTDTLRTFTKTSQGSSQSSAFSALLPILCWVLLIPVETFRVLPVQGDLYRYNEPNDHILKGLLPIQVHFYRYIEAIDCI
ncbi:hypothetical protein Golax_009029 [Gossypium laxum]|uniref:Uncharacterized protein n=1 Tax=Gossypium laxum TaxID=34288 RepID=A0A7J9ABR0_9ROSI|nr:hypothetical protein [Gossypium laxum]